MKVMPVRLIASAVVLLAWSFFSGAALGQSVAEQLTVTGIQSDMQAQQAGGPANAAAPAAGANAAPDTAAANAAAPAAAPTGPGVSASPVFLISPIKPVFVLLALLGWAWVISHLDKDAAYFYLERYWWNLGQMACGAIGFGLMLLIPIFPIGWILGVMVLAGGILGYAYYRNTRVPEDARWSLSLDSFRQKYEAAQHRRAQGKAALVFLTKEEGRMDVPSGDDPRAEAHATLENVLDFAIPRGADQMQIVVDPQTATLAARIDGVQYPQPAMEPRQAVVLIDYLKEVAGLDVQDRRKRQHGSVKLDAGELGRHTLEIETAGSTRGVQMIMQIDAQRRKQMPIGSMGLLESQRNQLKQFVADRGKVMIVTAAPKHGLTTTLYSLVAEHDPYINSVLTLEKEVTLELEGVTHNEMDDASPQQWNEKLAAIIRSDPQVVMLDHLPDDNIAQLIARSSEEIRFYVGMNEDDTLAALGRWVKMLGGNRKLAANSLGAIMAQRLVRKLCMTCRAPYQPDPTAIRKLNLPVGKVGQFYHSSGQVMERDKPVPCPDCLGLGYKGRVGVYELMVLDDTARSLLAAGDVEKLRSHLRKHKMLMLNEAGVAKVVEGTTDVKEITRALQSRKKQTETGEAA